MSLIQQITRHKSIEQLQSEAGARGEFRRVLGLWQLTAIGLGGIIGVGIFVLAGQQAAANAGPAVALAFIIAGIASAAAALCYAEFAGMIPVTGSAYTYGYAVLGEGVAWLIGWDLLLEYALIVAAVSSGWAGYLQNLLGHVGIHLPVWAQGAMGTGEGRVFNVIAALVAMGVAVLLTMRTETGARLNTIVVAVKVVGVALVIGVGAFYINTANWFPFIPPEVVGANGEKQFGFQGVVAAASVVFFAVFGYDTLTTAAEESKNPQRDLPRAILLSLGVSMVLYLTISLVITGVAHYSTLNNDAPVANAFQSLGLTWISAAISAVAVASIISVVFAFMLAAARIWFSLARDGLLPQWFAKVHPRYGTPYRPTLILGLLTGLAAGAMPIGDLAKLVNIGVLCAFIVICGSIIVLRRTRPEVKRAFRTPLVPLVPIVGIVFSIWLLTGLPWITWERFLMWMALGLVVYFGYGIRHSVLAKRG
ncbi:amino acid/polyamine/organocation transporter (APC superfamily) [Tahibacter aquaticus]|uniref:Amino acid/polyamine/organocation transporter (APC superfamily) n=1 Tax=Tahibacter aquaticus TaxID=520092 RepID=A0A4R6YMY4_9GAMM|nr:amino acid permease [Tahibacter aquaticus]TDR38914.1 amino acid/polyamine/organocation transporter (APC superfamily) [Tahibacter aquaticus]